MNKYVIGTLLLIIIFGSAFLLLNKKPASIQQKVNRQNPQNYKMKILSDESIVTPKEPYTLRYVIVDSSGTVLKNFLENHTKLMHFIAIRKEDLNNFQHLHPEFDANTGEFTQVLTFASPGTYRLYADFTPQTVMGNSGEVTLNQDVSVGETPSGINPIIADSETIKSVDGYEIEYSFPQPVKAGQAVNLILNVKKDGQPVTNMESYLSAQAHGIVLKKDTLDFAHLHAMGGEMMTMHGPLPTGPEIKFDYTFPNAGIYKLFSQFQVNGKVITSDYTFEVK